MSPLERLLTDYGRIHRHPVNRRLHGIGIPLVMLGIAGLVHLLPSFHVAGHTLDPLPLWLLAMLFVFGRWSWPLAMGLQLAVLLLLTAVSALLAVAGVNDAQAAGIFAAAIVAGSLLHMIGHRVFERVPAQFNQTPAFLLAGPLELAAAVSRRCGIIREG